MALPFNLQRLPPEAISLLRFLGKRNAPATIRELEAGIPEESPRSILRAIRRLINFSLIQMDIDGAYLLTSDGKRAFQQLLTEEAAGSSVEAVTVSRKISRRLTVVVPGSIIAGKPVPIFIGIDPPPTGAPLLAQSASVDLKLGAAGATLSTQTASLDVPPDKAASPTRITLMASTAGRIARVQIDAFQAHDIDRLEPAGAMYFDVPVIASAAASPAPPRAVAVELTLS
jgi:hypothetical protein